MVLKYSSQTQISITLSGGAIVDFSNESRNLQIANYLQTLRLEQNLTLEQLADMSHIPIAHLTSIEEGRFNKFDDFYLRMYLKKYTQTLGVNLEQLYAYARQQPIEELPKEKKEAPAKPVINPDSMQHKVEASQPTSIEAPSRKQPQIKRRTPTVSPFGPTQTKPKVNIVRILISLFLVLLVGLLLFFIFDFFRNMGNREALPEDPPVIENPLDIDLDLLDPDEDEDDEDGDGEIVPTEPETTEETTTIDLYSHVGRIQTFNVETTATEIEFRVEFSADCWLILRFDDSEILSGTQSETIEETFVLDGSGLIDFDLGNLFGVESITINGEEVEYNNDESVQHLIFNVNAN